VGAKLPQSSAGRGVKTWGGSWICSPTTACPEATSSRSTLETRATVLSTPGWPSKKVASWLRRVRESGGRDGTLHLATSGGSAEVRVSAEEIRILQDTSGPANARSSSAFAHLLFRGFDEDAEARLGVGQDLSLLRKLFPEQDFVVWRSDAF